MATTTEITDKLIADLDSAFGVLLQKIMGVMDDMQYRSITGTRGFNDPKLIGETKVTVDRAQAVVNGILVVTNLAGQRLTDVKAKRATIKTGFFSGGGAFKELEDQLCLHNLSLAGIKGNVPDALKSLLATQIADTTSVELALQVGSEQLKVSAKAIIEVDDCINTIKAQIADTEAKLAQVLPTATRIGGSAQLAHSNAVTNLANVKAACEFDPLGVRKGFDKTVGQHLATINAALDADKRAKEKAYSGLGDAKVLMQRLEDKQPSPARLPELRDWLAKLSTRLDHEEWGSASQGLDDWIKDASAVLSIKVPPPSYQPPPVVHQPPPPPVPSHGQGHTQPPVYTHPPTPQHVEQLPTSADYHKYTPKEKSNLEKLLDGEMASSQSSTSPAAEKPVDPEVEKLFTNKPPAAKTATDTPGLNHALDDLVHGPGKQPTPPASSSGTQSNAALEELLKGGAAKHPAPATEVKPGGTTGDTDAAALERLLKGQSPTSPTNPPGSATPKPPEGKPSSALEDLISDKKPAKTPAPAGNLAGPTVSSNSDSSKLTELFGEKKSTPTPVVPAKDESSTAAPAQASTLSKAEQDAANRKALEALLKG